MRLVRIDLIYEGIATLFKRLIEIRGACPNWPDLRRDCDSTIDSLYFILIAFLVRIDLIYEGIATYTMPSLLSVLRYRVRIDLIYEGIATIITTT